MKKIFLVLWVFLFVGCFEKDNLVTTYYDDAKKVVKEIYVVDPVSGLKDSVYKSFYENGNPKEFFVYKKGLRHGPAAYYYENGRLKSEGAFARTEQLSFGEATDERTGPWIYYDENGAVTGKSWYSHDEIIFSEGKKFVDKRDCKEYGTVIIGNHIWMSENLNFDTGKGSVCYKKDLDSCAKYGRLYYNYGKIESACPAGWHLPKSDEIREVFAAANNGYPVHKMLSMIYSSGAGTVVPSLANFKDDGGLTFAAFWGARTKNPYDCKDNPTGEEKMDHGYMQEYYYCQMHYSEGKVTVRYTDGPAWAFGPQSIRCVKDDSSWDSEDETAAQCKTNANKDSLSVVAPPKGSMRDSRDGQEYETVKIGDQIWMAENLNYKFASNCYKRWENGMDMDVPCSTCFLNDEKQCEETGRLYSQAGALKACPEDWRLPTLSDLIKLFGTVSDSNYWRSTAFEGYFEMSDSVKNSIGRDLKAAEGWYETAIGTGKAELGSDKFGFSGIPSESGSAGDLFAGIGLDKRKIKDKFCFWTNYKYTVCLNAVSEMALMPTILVFDAGRSRVHSVRCVKDYSTKNSENPYKAKASESQLSLATSQEDDMRDPRDGQSYKTITVNSQTWMAENLNYETDSSWCYDDNPDNCKNYGRLYEWNAAQSACPNGWRIATDAEWNAFADNYTLFNIKSAGFRNSKGNYELLGKRADFWTADDVGDKGKYYYYSASTETMSKNTYSKKGAMSVRCIKD